MNMLVCCIFVIYTKKMKKIIILLFFGLSLSLVSCKVEPKEIDYGNDHCYHCDMTVVDKTHASQYVTKKGRAYTFDAIECMVLKLKDDKNEDLMEYILVADYANPGVLIDAKNATYLISDKIKSPMGANLSAFSSKKNAQEFLEDNGGILLTWSELKNRFSK